MKTLVIVNFPKEEDWNLFESKFGDLLTREDVILIKNPENIADLEQKLEDRRGEFDRVIITGHGLRKTEARPSPQQIRTRNHNFETIGETDVYGRKTVRYYQHEDIPLITATGDSSIPFTDLLKIVNNYGEPKQVHFAACHIGAYSDKVTDQEVESKYYQELSRALPAGQTLFLHGDNGTGEVVKSLGLRITGIITNPDYDTASAILDAHEALTVVAKSADEIFVPKPGLLNKLLGRREQLNRLSAFTYKMFGFNDEVKFTKKEFGEHLEKEIAAAHEFEEQNQIASSHHPDQRLRELKAEGLQEYLDQIFLRSATKSLDSRFKEAFDVVLKKIADGANPNSVDDRKNTLLHIATNNKHSYAVRELIKIKGINPNAADVTGRTPLMMAARSRFYEGVEAILEHEETDPNIADKNGWTALMEAAVENNHREYELLIKKGADSSLRNNQGQTAAEIARDFGSLEVLKEIHESTKKSETPFSAAESRETSELKETEIQIQLPEDPTRGLETTPLQLALKNFGQNQPNFRAAETKISNPDDLAKFQNFVILAALVAVVSFCAKKLFPSTKVKATDSKKLEERSKQL